MIYRMAGNNDLFNLAEIRWDFHYENRQKDENTFKDQFVDYCYEFLKDGLNSGE